MQQYDLVKINIHLDNTIIAEFNSTANLGSNIFIELFKRITANDNN